jgi:hypothetical protein
MENHYDVFADLLKVAGTLASKIEVGDEVRVNLGNGSHLRGLVQAVDGDVVTVRGRKFPISSVETADEIEDIKERNIRSLREDEQEQARAAEADAMRGGRGGDRTPRKPSGAPLDLSGLAPLVSGLKVDIRLYWQDHYDGLAQEWFADHGVPLGNCVANVFGVRGGVVPQWGICGKVTIEPVPNDQALYTKIMRELSQGDSEPQVVGNKIVVNGYRAAGGAAKALPGTPAHS